jgi:superfamily I DNA and RNA helicase
MAAATKVGNMMSWRSRRERKREGNDQDETRLKRTVEIQSCVVHIALCRVCKRSAQTRKRTDTGSIVDSISPRRENHDVEGRRQTNMLIVEVMAVVKGKQRTQRLEHFK